MAPWRPGGPHTPSAVLCPCRAGSPTQTPAPNPMYFSPADSSPPTHRSQPGTAACTTPHHPLLHLPLPSARSPQPPRRAPTSTRVPADSAQAGSGVGCSLPTTSIPRVHTQLPAPHSSPEPHAPSITPHPPRAPPSHACSAAPMHMSATAPSTLPDPIPHSMVLVWPLRVRSPWSPSPAHGHPRQAPSPCGGVCPAPTFLRSAVGCSRRRGSRLPRCHQGALPAPCLHPAWTLCSASSGTSRKESFLLVLQGK